LNSLAFLEATQEDFRAAERLWYDAANRFEKVRLRTSHAGLRRIDFAVKQSPHTPLAACFAQNGKSIRAWESYEASLARGLFDALSARTFRPLSEEERNREIELTARLTRTEELIGTFGETENKEESNRTLRELRLEQQRLNANLAAFEAEISNKYGIASGKSFDLSHIQEQLPTNAALVGWVDVEHPLRRSSFSEHWGCVLRSDGDPIWVELPGTGHDGTWTDGDRDLASVVRDDLAQRSTDSENNDLSLLCQQLLAQRLIPIESHISDVTQLIVLPAGQMAGIPIEALTDKYAISYAPSATMYAWLRESRRSKVKDPKSEETERKPPWEGEVQRRPLLAVGDPMIEEFAKSDTTLPEFPDYGIMLVSVIEGKNAYRSGLRLGDVLLSYGNDRIVDSASLDAAKTKGELLAELDAEVSIPVQVWRDGNTLDLAVAPGMLGVTPSQIPASEAIPALRRLDGAVLKAKRQTFPALPGSRLEVETIANLFNSRDMAVAPTVLLGSCASESRLASFAASDMLRAYGMIHIATHALMDDKVAMRSALILSHEEFEDAPEVPFQTRAINDGRLTAEQIVRTWKLDADLVTLSGCETALGKKAGGEGYLGFSQALFVAGARSLVLSLWKVEDTPTMLLMRRFYENLLGLFDEPRQAAIMTYDPNESLPKTEALHEAKRWLRSLSWDELVEFESKSGLGTYRGSDETLIVSSDGTDRPFEHPHYWAAFILMGDPD